MSTNVTKEQIEQARQLDLLSYLQQYEPQELAKTKGNIYTTRSHDSLKISNGRWFRWSTGMGGVSALDFLIKVRNMGFVEAVQHLCECMRIVAIPRVTPITVPPKPKQQFMLPQRNANNHRVIDYLMKRGISTELIQFCIDTGRLYEDTMHNCCFVGFDRQGEPRYAMLRSSNPASTFLREVAGSDKRFSFAISGQESRILYLFESAIDALSYIELRKLRGEKRDNADYLSMSGIHQIERACGDNVLPAALAQHLQDNKPVNHIAICFDNDDAGIRAAQAICVALPERYTTELLPPKVGKDFNAQLMFEKHLPMTVKTRGTIREKEQERDR